MINVSKLHKSHGKLHVLNGVDLEVRRGEIAVLVGPSGGGKSTMLRCINGLEPFQSGEVRIESLRLGPDTERRNADMRALRQRVGMVFQQFHLFPHLSVLDNVTISPRISQGIDQAAAEITARELLERVGLGDKISARPSELSGGQQQRVAIARALAVKPIAILFDEPTSALDPRMADEVQAVIADLASDGLTMIVVTHAMGFAKKVANTVHVMHAGQVAESGPPEQIFSNPKTEATRKFLAESHSS